MDKVDFSVGVELKVEVNKLFTARMMRFDTMEALAALNAATVSAATIEKIGNKRVYYCQRCLNHNRLEPRKNHKCDCIYANCTCNKCILVEKRRILNIQLHELEEVTDNEINEMEDTNESYNKIGSKMKGERVPNCQKCGQHGRKSRLKGHKRICPFRDCNCVKCQVVSERQKLMADQIKIRRRQRKDTIMSITRDNITATLNVAAAVAATSSLPYYNNLNSILYRQLQQSMQQSSLLMMNPSALSSLGIAAADSSSANNLFGCVQSDILDKAMTNSRNKLAELLLSQASVANQSTLFSPLTSSSMSPAVSSTSLRAPPTLNIGDSQIAIPVAINPTRSSCSLNQTNFPLKFEDEKALSSTNDSNGINSTDISNLFDNEHLFQAFLSNMRMLEQKLGSESIQDSSGSAFIGIRSL